MQVKTSKPFPSRSDPGLQSAREEGHNRQGMQGGHRNGFAELRVKRQPQLKRLLNTEDAERHGAEDAERHGTGAPLTPPADRFHCYAGLQRKTHPQSSLQAVVWTENGIAFTPSGGAAPSKHVCTHERCKVSPHQSLHAKRSATLQRHTQTHHRARAPGLGGESQSGP
eukprot:964906-Pelagomonas_calceolata.AAC.1